MEWAAFHVIELMSSPRFSQKRSGYLACEQCFGANPELLLLTTNLFRKDLSGASHLDTCVALNTLAMVCTTDLAHSLADECLTLLNNSKPVLRKKATALFCKIYYFMPEHLSLSLDRITEKLRDDSPSVALNAVNTLYEQARRTPQAVLYTASSLYELLRSTRSNWMLIKLLKLVIRMQFSILCRVEPRLLKKLVEPVATLMERNEAKSVEYEVIVFVLMWYSEQTAMKNPALAKMITFIESPDANRTPHSVKYLGLKCLQLAFSQRCISLDDFKAYITDSLTYRDMTIRKQALQLLVATTTADTLTEAISSILREIKNPECAEIKENLISTVLFLLGKNQYELVLDFKWMFEVLCLLVREKTEMHEGDIAGMMLDVVVRVEGLGEEAVGLGVDMIRALEEWKTEKGNALAALIFIIGEHGITCATELRLEALTLLTSLRIPELRLPEYIHSAIVCAAFKLYLSVIDLTSDALTSQVTTLFTTIPAVGSIEPRDRSQLYLKVINGVPKEALVEAAKRLTPLLPINPLSQSMLKCPEDLLTPFEVDLNEIRKEREDGSIEYFYYREEDFVGQKDIQTKEIKKKLKEELAIKNSGDPFYVKTGKKKKGKKGKKAKSEVEVKEEVKEEKGEVLPVPDVSKKYRVNRDLPGIPEPPA